MTKRQQQIVMVAGLAIAIIVAGAYLFAVKPKLSERSTNQAAAVVAEASATQLQAQLVELKRKEAGLAEARASVEELTKKFPNSFEQDAWLQMIQRVGNSAGVTLTQVSPGIPGAATGAVTPGSPATPAAPPAGGPAAPAAESQFLVAESIITISATGSDAAIANFLSGLEGMERPMLIDAVSITFNTTDSGSTNEGTIAITGKTFLSRPLDPPPAVVNGAPEVAAPTEAPEGGIE